MDQYSVWELFSDLVANRKPTMASSLWIIGYKTSKRDIPESEHSGLMFTNVDKLDNIVEPTLVRSIVHISLESLPQKTLRVIECTQTNIDGSRVYCPLFDNLLSLQTRMERAFLPLPEGTMDPRLLPRPHCIASLKYCVNLAHECLLSENWCEVQLASLPCVLGKLYVPQCSPLSLVSFGSHRLDRWAPLLDYQDLLLDTQVAYVTEIVACGDAKAPGYKIRYGKANIHHTKKEISYGGFISSGFLLLLRALEIAKGRALKHPMYIIIKAEDVINGLEPFWNNTTKFPRIQPEIAPSIPKSIITEWKDMWPICAKEGWLSWATRSERLTIENYQLSYALVTRQKAGASRIGMVHYSLRPHTDEKTRISGVQITYVAAFWHKGKHEAPIFNESDVKQVLVQLDYTCTHRLQAGLELTRSLPCRLLCLENKDNFFEKLFEFVRRGGVCKNTTSHHLRLIDAKENWLLR